jgi:PilZ domain
MTTTRPDTEQRRFKRIPFDAKAEMLCAGYHWHIKVIDLSLRGALLECPTAWEGKTGDHCLLKISLGDEEAQIKMQASIVRIEAPRIGLKCVDIDIDSITCLRRFVELNLGNQDLLHRELSALGAPPKK